MVVSFLGVYVLCPRLEVVPSVLIAMEKSTHGENTHMFSWRPGQLFGLIRPFRTALWQKRKVELAEFDLGAF